MPYARNLKELMVYQEARSLAQSVFELSKRFPREETYALTDQVRRSSRAIGAAIAEAWAKRRYEKHFISKLTDADGEQMETQHWIETAVDCGYLHQTEASKMLAACSRIGRLIGGMIAKSDKFCGPPHALREPDNSYFIIQENQSL